MFGDGAVVLKQAPGHTPGHLGLYLKLAKTGAVVLSGDIYHYPQERTMNRYSDFRGQRGADTGVALRPRRLKASRQL